MTTFLQARIKRACWLLPVALLPFAAQAQAPANDNPGTATVLPVGATCTPVSATNTGATTTAVTGLGYDNPGCGIALSPKDVWFTFTTNATGPGSTAVIIRVAGTVAGQVRAFRTSTGATGPFTEIGCSSGTAINTQAGPLALFNLTPSTAYYVFVSGYGSTDAQGAFTICATQAPNNDATVTNIQTLGTVSSAYGSPVTVSAVVRNVGGTAQTALPVTLAVAGATTFTNTRTVPSLAPGASVTVTFAAYPVATAGVNTLTVTVPSDDVTTNNSQAYSQNVTTGTQGYVDTTQPFAAGGVGVGQAEGVLAVRYSSSSAAAITAITPTFQGAGTPNTTYQLQVYAATAAGAPGALLYTSPTLSRPAASGAVPTTLPGIPVNGNFFIAMKELNNNVGLANQLEDPLRAGTFFFTTTGGATWTDVNTTRLLTRLAFDVTLGVAPACGVPLSPVITGITNTTASLGFTPAAGAMSYIVTYTPAGGTATTVTPAPMASLVALTGLTPGTTYTVSIATACAAGQASSAVTTAFSTVPANDQCGTAIALACGVPVVGTTVGATAVGDPVAVCSAGSPLTPSASPGVFYRFAGNGQVATVSTCSGPSAATGDTKLFVYSGSCGTLTCVGSNDDFPGCGTNTSASSVTFPTTAGTDYFIFVQFFQTATGPFGLNLTCRPPVVTTYATLPFAESFEGPWISGLNTRDLPSASWRNAPATGNASWRRSDDGASAGWTFAASGAYTPTSSQGTYSARFHSSWASGGPTGALDLYVNLSGASAKTLTFDYVNPTSSTTNPADKLDVLVSTDGGITFGTTPILALTNNATFATKTVSLTSTSATTVIRFRATADFGDDDIGIDNVRIGGVVTGTRNEALAATVGLYPNPARQRFTLALPAGSLHSAAATLVNAVGQVVLARQLALPAAGGTTDFDVSGLPAGVYALRLQAGADLVVKRLVIE